MRDRRRPLSGRRHPRSHAAKIFELAERCKVTEAFGADWLCELSEFCKTSEFW
jgi:hypothetical protein